jgi:uncharacterized protein (TIGR03083 family)
MAEEHATAYRGVRERTSDLVRGASATVLEETAPATPAWRVKDVVAHLVGVSADAAEGRVEGVATDPWTAAQVDARRGVPIADLLAEWARYGPQFEGALEVIPTALASQAVFDAITHEHDIRHALGRPGARDCDAVDIGFEFVIDGRTALGMPALRVVTDDGEHVTGVGEPCATLTTTRFEYIRAVAGRRTGEEIAAYGWEGTVDPAIVLGAPIFRMRATPLGE